MNLHTNMDLTKSVVIPTNFCTIPVQQFPYYFTEKYFHNYKNTTPHYYLFNHLYLPLCVLHHKSYSCQHTSISKAFVFASFSLAPQSKISIHRILLLRTYFLSKARPRHQTFLS